MSSSTTRALFSRRRLLALTGAAGLATAAGVPKAHAATGPEGRETSVRIMTWNVHAAANARHVFDIEPQAEVMARSGAHIIGLQEVDKHWSGRSDWMDTVAYYADYLGMDAFYAPILDNPPAEEGRPRRQFGCAILSSYPVTARTDHEILRLQDWTTGGFPEVVVNCEGASLHVYNTHLDYRPDPVLREGQVDDMLEYVAADRGQKVLLGDLNARPDAPELAPLLETFTDAWTVAGEGEGYTFDAIDPDRRIDYVLVGGGPRVSAIEVLDTQVSDHRPVVADLVVTRGVPAAGAVSGGGEGRTA